jgi:peptide/nickel transport system substrate-binding protein
MTNWFDFDERLAANLTRTDFLKLIGAGAGAAAMGGVLAACGGSSSAANSSGASSGGSSGSKDTLTIAYQGDPGTLQPQFVQTPQEQEIVINTYDTVVDYPSGAKTYKGQSYLQADYSRPEPGLVQKIDRSADGKTYTITIRDGLVFPSGRAMTMLDVMTSFDAMFKAAGVGAFLLSQGGVTKRSQITTLDSKRFKIEASVATPITLAVFGIWALTFYDAQALKKHATSSDPYANNWLTNNVDGYGAYTIQQHEPGVQMVLQANPKYFRGQPKIKTVTLKIIPSPQERASLLEEGTVDMATYLAPRDAAQLKSNPSLNVLSVPFINRPYVGFNVKQKPFDNKLIRQALSYATPYDQIISSVYYGEARRATSVVALGFPGQFNGTWPYNYDLQKAKSLLSQASASNLSFDVTYNESFTTHEAIATILASSWSQIGVTANLTKVSAAQFASLFDPTKRNTPVWIEETFSVIPDPYYELGLFFSDAGFHNWGHYHNAALESAIAHGQFLSNTKERLSLIEQAQSSMVADPPWIFLAQLNQLVPTRKSVTGYTLYYDGLTRYRLLSNG